ncbi:MAG: hypothetical protein QOE69_476 [Thermoleophilaceae bacterium]|nr:hypothetical protein [Thermoleophilaceae bacterium]
MSAHFDPYADRYEDEVEQSIAFAGQEHEFYVEVKACALLELAREQLGDLSRVRALDVGCGVGLTDGHLIPALGAVEGVDVSEPEIERARAANPAADYRAYDGGTLPFPDDRFDLTFAICVVHHVEPPDRPRLLAEMARVTRPGGLVAVFEHNPLNPLTRLAVRNCSFDEGVVLVGARSLARQLRGAGLTVLASRYVLFFPWRGERLRRLERRLAPVPLGAQYLVAARRSG